MKALSAKVITAVGVLLVLLLGGKCAQISATMQKHDEEFRASLNCTIRNYLVKHGNAADRVDAELLRRGPTITGLAYPKYYAWVSGLSRGESVIQGAARVVELRESKLEVTHFLTSREIIANPASVGEVFPAPLVADIVRRADESRSPSPSGKSQ